SYSGFVNGDTSAALDTAPTASTAATTASNVGTYAITPAGGSDNNYSFSYTNGTLTINKRDITATVHDQNRDYADANPVLTWADVAWNNLAGADTGAVLDTVGLTIAGTAPLSANAGTTHAIDLTGFSDNNYNLTGYTAGTLTIDPAALLITADDASR